MAGTGELPSGTVTLVFTDIEGSTRLLRQLGDLYGGALADYRRLLRSAFEERGGREIDTQGDALFFAFRRAKDAVAATVAGQRALSENEWPEGTQLKVRIGIHTGEPSLGEEGYHGLGLHRGARICAAGHGGQILLSTATRSLIEDELPEGIELEDLGEKRLKDFDRPERIFQVIYPGMPPPFPPLKTLDAQSDAPFSGREEELAARPISSVARVVAVLQDEVADRSEVTLDGVGPRRVGRREQQLDLLLLGPTPGSAVGALAAPESAVIAARLGTRLALSAHYVPYLGN